MTDTLIEVEEEITLDDLNVYWADNGLPIFLADRDDICDIVENMGFSIYYLLCNSVKVTSKTSTNPTTKVTTTEKIENRSMQLFKVVNNFVGRSVSMANEPFNTSFLSVEESAEYTMPAIPHVIVEKLDQFFRLIDAQHGTESIVMLTYDTTKEGPDGWGILVPDQSNTAVHCNYDPDSIAQIKPDHVMIVGSVHSHPNMAAYASGTDHQDQADFDGLHITYGWQKSVNNGATQYHIELQMSGKSYTLTPDDVFEDVFIDKEPDPEVVEWSGKVKKVLPPSTGGTYTGGTYPTSTTYPRPTTGAPTAPGKSKSTKPSAAQKEWGLESLRKQFEQIDRFDIEDNALVVVEIEEPISRWAEVPCPSCATGLDDFNFQNGYCDFCYIPVVGKNTSFEQIIEKLELYCEDMHIDSDVPVYLWTIGDNNEHALMKIVASLRLSNFGKTAKTDEDLLDDANANDDDDARAFSVCCGERLLENGPTCNCDPVILFDDVLDFDRIIGSIHLYETTGTQCNSCEHYYDPSCPQYRDVLAEWIKDKSIDVVAYERQLNDSSCTMYEPFQSSYSGYSYWE